MKEIVLPEGWEIDKIENGKIFLKESKKELPKTWEECVKLYSTLETISSMGDIYDVYNINPTKRSLPVGLGKPMLALQQLLVCREVYRQGWKPDWKDNNIKYGITINYNNVIPSEPIYGNTILSFQSKEIRDKFLENFKDLIEEAKELL